MNHPMVLQNLAQTLRRQLLGSKKILLLYYVFELVRNGADLNLLGLVTYEVRFSQSPEFFGKSQPILRFPSLNDGSHDLATLGAVPDEMSWLTALVTDAATLRVVDGHVHGDAHTSMGAWCDSLEVSIDWPGCSGRGSRGGSWWWSLRWTVQCRLLYHEGTRCLLRIRGRTGLKGGPWGNRGLCRATAPHGLADLLLGPVDDDGLSLPSWVRCWWGVRAHDPHDHRGV